MPPQRDLACCLVSEMGFTVLSQSSELHVGMSMSEEQPLFACTTSVSSARGCSPHLAFPYLPSGIEAKAQHNTM